MQASRQAWRWQKYVSSKKLQSKINPDNAIDNILNYKASIIWSVMQFEVLLFFSLLWGQLCASVLLYLGIISNAFSLSNFMPFLIKKWELLLSQNGCQ